MALPTSRFREANQAAWWHNQRNLVQCPRCAHQAVVQREEAEGRWSARVTCASCGYSRSQHFGEGGWAGPVSVFDRARCAKCTRPLERRSRRRHGPPRRPPGKLKCPGCGTLTPVTSRVWDPIGGATAVDPYFGLPLWLQAPCCGEVLWAVNEAHLTYLYNYIAATLREREPNRNTSTVSRLPTWLKEAKHRDAILSCIARLRQSLAESRAVAPAS